MAERRLQREHIDTAPDRLRDMCVAQLWAALEAVLAAQPPTAHGPLEPELRDYILLITILVAFLEPAARELKSISPALAVSLLGLLSHPDPASPA